MPLQPSGPAPAEPSMHAPKLLLATLLLALGIGLTQAAEAAPQPLRVLTFNAWGVPVVTPARAERVAAMGAAIAELAPDVVAFQEVWLEEDAERLMAELAARGLPHGQRFDRGRLGGSGLVVVSRFPLEDATFAAYSQGGRPKTPWHLDWAAAKGIGKVRIHTPAGPVELADTHLQAGYGTADYQFVQIAQVLEAARALEQRQSGGDEVPPLIVAGDLNAPAHALPFRLLAARLQLEPTDPHAGIDAILTRPGSGTSVATRSVQRVLADPVRLSNGELRPLSDHAGVLVELELTRGEGAAELLTAEAPWSEVALEALPLLSAELRAQVSRGSTHLWLGVGLFDLAVLLFVLRRRLRAPRAAVVLATVVLLFGGGWLLYLGTGYAPAQVANLYEVQAQLLRL